MRNQLMIGGISLLLGWTGCTVNVDPTSDPAGAAIIGSVVDTGSTFRQINDGCPDIRIELNGAEATLVFDDGCGFLINDVAPVGVLEIGVFVPDLGIASALEVREVLDRQLIEIMVEITDDTLTLTVVRQQQPEVMIELPSVVSANNAMFQITVGRFDADLTILGNNFTLVGESGAGCNDDGWSVLAGNLVIEGNNATFRNVKVEGSVQVLGNNAHFINTCFDDQLIVFGNNLEIDPGDEHDDGDDD